MFLLFPASRHCLTPAKLQSSAFGAKSTDCMRGQLHFPLLIQHCTRGTLTPTKETVQHATRQALDGHLLCVLHQTVNTKDKGNEWEVQEVGSAT